MKAAAAAPAAVDAFERAAIAIGADTSTQLVPAQPAGLAAPATDAPAAPVKVVYPEFVANQWRNHPFTHMVNNGADFGGKMLAPALERGTASKCDLGESYAFCASYYMDQAKNLPPWAYPLISTGAFAMALGTAFFAKKALEADTRQVRDAAGDKKLAAKLAAAKNVNPTREDDGRDQGDNGDAADQ